MWAYVEAIAAEDVDRLVSLANSKAWDSERFNICSMITMTPTSGWLSTLRLTLSSMR